MIETVKELRLKGKSIREICIDTGLAKSTVSYHINKLGLSTPVEVTVDRRAAHAKIGHDKYMENKSLERNQRLREAKDLYEIYKLDPNFMSFLSLYWGEGSKCGYISIANSDIGVVKHCKYWFEKLSDQRFNRIRLAVYPDQSEEELLNYWSKGLGINKADIKVWRKPSTKIVQSHVGTFYLGYGDIKVFTYVMEWIRLHREEIMGTKWN